MFFILMIVMQYDKSVILSFFNYQLNFIISIVLPVHQTTVLL